jgi:hypothetical protein
LDRVSLDSDLLAAHALGDPGGLVTLYLKAGDLMDAEGDIDAACFYLTHAMVFAFEAGDARAGAIQHRLVAHGRELP